MELLCRAAFNSGLPVIVGILFTAEFEEFFKIINKLKKRD
ncbi:hypothetical protein VCRLGP7_950008 [Vibrio crassostreae]|nr:hypothetical protein VCRA2119O53_210043 [Vibrio crassostreae]CAK2479621.1 hypothetical protein VCRA2116O33_290043 [Vibrio crassostreae]CAK2778391.1 hypothetical protein VCRA2113O24_290044 [Vibrio crassostreae]CAK3490276.1 hypothetical protein VCRA2120O63_310005 [Vibrio crassostreae]CDT68908.1 hypothetical protein VCRLGP7_950008 [Vibrio crassostreae]